MFVQGSGSRREIRQVEMIQQSEDKTIEAGQSPRTPQRDEGAVVAIYDTHTEAEAAIRELQKMGFDMKKLSIVGKDSHTEEDVVGYYTTGDRMKKWGKFGAFWGGIWGLLFGSAFFLVPGIGPVVAAGPIVAWIVGALGTSALAGGVTALGAALVSIGIPKDSVIAYESALREGKFVLIAHDLQGAEDKAMIALQKTRHRGVSEHAVRA
jgi:uncharacterized membrane protein